MGLTAAFMGVAFAFGFLLGKGYGPLMLKIAILPFALAKRGK
jgi:hypothetical protein